MPSLQTTPPAGITVALPRLAIDPGCIRCNWCANLLTQVFVIGADTAAIRPEVLDPDQRLRAGILGEDDLRFLGFVADGCPSRVIRIDGE